MKVIGIEFCVHLASCFLRAILGAILKKIKFKTNIKISDSTYFISWMSGSGSVCPISGIFRTDLSNFDGTQHY